MENVVAWKMQWRGKKWRGKNGVELVGVEKNGVELSQPPELVKLDYYVRDCAPELLHS